MLKTLLFVTLLGNLILLALTHHTDADSNVVTSDPNSVESTWQDYEVKNRNDAEDFENQNNDDNNDNISDDSNAETCDTDNVESTWQDHEGNYSSDEKDTENQTDDNDYNTQDDTKDNGSEKDGDGGDNIIDDGDDSVDVEAQQLFEKGNNEFALKFLEIVSKLKEGENVVCSSLTTLSILAQLAPFARGHMREELITAFNLQKKPEKAKNVFLDLRKSLELQKNITVSMVSNVYADKKYALTNDFINFSHKYFGADVENIDFTKSAEAAETINSWVEDHTNKQIKNLVTPDMFSAMTRVVLVNALYFKGLWKSTFDSKYTKDGDFYKSNNEIIKVPMMYQKSKFLYGRNEDFQIIEMPYSNTNMSMLVILPQTPQGLPEVMKKVQNNDVLKKACSDMRRTDVKVHFPKYKITTNINLVPVLKELGIQDIFKETANFTKILEHDEQMYVSDGVQKAFIEVEENGTEAAAANAVVVTALSASANPPMIPVFNANKPFFYAIVFKKESQITILFNGVYVGEK